MPPIHELHERLKRRLNRSTERADVNKPSTQELERPAGLNVPGRGPSTSHRGGTNLDDTQPIPIYSD